MAGLHPSLRAPRQHTRARGLAPNPCASPAPNHPGSRPRPLPCLVWQASLPRLESSPTPNRPGSRPRLPRHPALGKMGAHPFSSGACGLGPPRPECHPKSPGLPVSYPHLPVERHPKSPGLAVSPRPHWASPLPQRPASRPRAFRGRLQVLVRMLSRSRGGSRNGRAGALRAGSPIFKSLWLSGTLLLASRRSSGVFGHSTATALAVARTTC